MGPEYDEAYVEGYNANKMGIDEYSNPYYSLGFSEYKFYGWEDGWNNAESDRFREDNNDLSAG